MTRTGRKKHSRGEVSPQTPLKKERIMKMTPLQKRAITLTKNRFYETVEQASDWSEPEDATNLRINYAPTFNKGRITHTYRIAWTIEGQRQVIITRVSAKTLRSPIQFKQELQRTLREVRNV